MTEEAIGVVIVDDHPSLRDGVRTDLERSGVATVVSEAGDGGEAIEVVRGAMPDVVLLRGRYELMRYAIQRGLDGAG